MKLTRYFLAALAFTAATPAFADELQLTITPEMWQKLDNARNNLSPATGSSATVITKQDVENLPEGSFTPLNDVILQTPGVAQDSYGQLHVRGDHADLQYRLNGIILPEGITGFGQTLDTHFADSINVMTGALPAQYGYRTAGVVDIATKSSFDTGGRSSFMAGSDGTLDANQEFYGSTGHANYYFTADYGQNDRGVEPPLAARDALHDETRQDKEFGYMSYALNPETRVSLIFGNATNRFQIPNNPGQSPAFVTAPVASADVNEQQFEHNTYAIAALQGLIGDDTDYQLALFTRYSDVLFKPDALGDLAFNGDAARVYDVSMTEGVQNDFSNRISATHTLRAGWSASYENARSNTDSLLFSTTGPDCTSVACTPFSITDNHSKDAVLFGVYAQDEWKLLDKLTLNYGARFDTYSAYVDATQLSPRVGLVYEATPSTTLHAGYARYFTPPPTELIEQETIAAFENTTGAAASGSSSPVRPERDNYFDMGVIQKIGALTLGTDAYYKQARDLLDEGQFGPALIFAPFNYEKGYVHGIEFSGDYKTGAFSSYANLAWSRAEGKGIASGEYNFTDDDLAYIAQHYVHLDHDQAITGSAGAAYMWKTIKYSADMLYGSGLRDGDDNTGHLPFYTQVNAAISHTFDLGTAGSLDGTFSVINLLDRAYEIRDGSGIGVFAPQYGPRRGYFVSISKPF